MNTNKLIEEISKDFFKSNKYLRINFNWIESSIDDSINDILKKKSISKIKNQHMCGCCWVISCVTAISDSFVISGIVDWSPNISYTYAMAKYPQNQCSGGKSKKFLEDVKNGSGLASENCLDESWCLNDDKCNNLFSYNLDKQDLNYLTSLIPSPKCTNSNKKYLYYKIDQVYDLTNFDSNVLKMHIYCRGPLIGVIAITDKFIKFKSKDIFIEDLKDKILGNHSIVVLGWGTENNINYWYCRNSWGENWGDGGCCKIAVYPINKYCQFTHGTKSNGYGTVSGFLVTKYPELKMLNFQKNNYLIFVYILIILFFYFKI